MKEVVSCFPTPPKDHPLWLEMSGTSYCDGTYRIHRKCSPVTVVEYVLSGGGTVEIDGKVYHPQAGQIYILRQHREQCYRSDAKEPWVKIFFNLRGELADQLLACYGLQDTVLFDGAGLEGLFRRTLADTFDPLLSHEEVHAACALFFHELILHLAQGQMQSKSADGEMLRLQKHLLANLHRIVPNSELAALIFRSEDFCIKKFRCAFGATPYEYQIAQKISAAKKLLRSTRLSIGEIAARFGYSDQHYFSNLFRARCGVSPLQYRKG